MADMRYIRESLEQLPEGMLQVSITQLESVEASIGLTEREQLRLDTAKALRQERQQQRQEQAQKAKEALASYQERH